jgi:hypothetical protein
MSAGTTTPKNESVFGGSGWPTCTPPRGRPRYPERLRRGGDPRYRDWDTLRVYVGGDGFDF